MSLRYSVLSCESFRIRLSRLVLTCPLALHAAAFADTDQNLSAGTNVERRVREASSRGDCAVTMHWPCHCDSTYTLEVD